MPRARDLGGFEVRRALPAPKRQMVGPFIFFDQMGPAEFLPTTRHRRAPAPAYRAGDDHLSLPRPDASPRQPRHRQLDRAGRGELDGGGPRHHPFRAHRRRDAGRPHAVLRHPDLGRAAEGPRGRAAATSSMPPADALPLLEGEGKERAPDPRHRLWRTRARSRRPPRCSMPMRCWQPGARCPLPDDHEDRGVYVVEGAIEVAGETFEAGRMMVFRPGDRDHADGGRAGRAADAAGRRDAGRAALHLVELRRLLARSGSRPRRRPGARATGRMAASSCRRGTIAEFIPLPER